jgi:ribonuclease P protein component
MNKIYAEKNISTEQPPPRKETRLPGAYGDEERTGRSQAPESQGTQEINSSALLGFGLPKDSRLRKPAEFKRVYASGQRFEGRFMTVFVLASEGSDNTSHRLGITASKKMSNKAHDRNRAKRLLRESFRLSKLELAGISTKFDWVLNARRGLLKVKLEKPLAEFRQIVAKVKEVESRKGEKTFE